MELKFTVAKQTMVRIDHCKVASHSVDFLHASFNFMSPEWQGKVKTALFNGYAQILTDDSCIVPWEALTGDNLIVSVYGVDGSTRQTTQTVKIDIVSSGYEEGETPSEPTPTVYEQILARINNLTVGEISAEVIATAVSEYLEAHPIEGVTQEALANALADYVLTNDLPQSLPASDVHDWAKQAEKPTYTANEVGASPTGHNHNDAYYTKQEILNKLSGLSAGGGGGGADGVGISDIVKTGTSGLVDTYTIYFTDGTTSTFTVTNGSKGDKGDDGYTPVKGVDYFDGADGDKGDKGADGTDGKSVELRKTSTHIQWRLVGSSTWLDLIPLSEIKGDDGLSPTATVSKVGNKTTLSVTDKNGTTTAEVLDGANGFTRAEIEQIIADYLQSHNVEPSVPDEPVEPTEETVPEGTWQLKTTTPKKYIIIGTDDDNPGNAKFYRLCRTYGVPYTMNMASSSLGKNINGDDDNTIFTSTDAPSLFPNYVTTTDELAEYMIQNNSGEVALHGYKPLWDSDEMTDNDATAIYNNYVSQGGTKTKEDFIEAVLESASSTDWAQGGTIIRDTKEELEEGLGHQIYTLGIWGGATKATVDDIEVPLSVVQNKGTKKDIGAILKGYNFFGAGTVLNKWGNSTNYNINRWSGGLGRLAEGINGLSYGQCLEFFYHCPIGDETVADLRTYLAQLKQYENDGTIKLVTRKEYIDLGEWVTNPIESVSVSREFTEIGTPDTKSLYTIKANYADGTSADVSEEAILDNSNVDVTQEGSYEVTVYYRMFKGKCNARVYDAVPQVDSVVLENGSFSGGAVEQNGEFGTELQFQANTRYLVEADYEFETVARYATHYIGLGGVWTNNTNNIDSVTGVTTGHLNYIYMSSNNVNGLKKLFRAKLQNTDILSYSFTNVNVYKLIN